MESLGRFSEWASQVTVAAASSIAWSSSKTVEHFITSAAGANSSSSSSMMASKLQDASSSSAAGRWMADLPHAWSSDYREPVFTFMWNGKELGFYFISVMYWAEMLAVRRHFYLSIEENCVSAVYRTMSYICCFL